MMSTIDDWLIALDWVKQQMDINPTPFSHINPKQSFHTDLENKSKFAMFIDFHRFISKAFAQAHLPYIFIYDWDNQPRELFEALVLVKCCDFLGIDKYHYLDYMEQR